VLTRRQQLLHWVVERMQTRTPSLAQDLSSILGRPTVQDLSLAAPLFKDATACLGLVVDDIDHDLLLTAVDEFHELSATLARRRAERVLRYPSNFPVQTQTGLLLYTLVRLARPRVLLEVGVADGYSTALILGAIQKNGLGELHSLDIRDDVGVLVDDRLHWHLHVSTDQNPFTGLGRLAGWIQPLDVFFHDSDHRFVPQAREYELAEGSLRPGGYLVSDDVDFSYAFIRFVESRKHPSAILLDDVKCSGVMRIG